MTDTNTNHLSWDEWDELQNPPPAVTDFDRVVERAISRRGFLGVLAMGSAAVAMGSVGNLMNSTSAQAQEAASRFPFKPIAIATDTTIHVPEGYSWRPLAKWGQPLFSNVADIDPVNGVSLEASDKVFGENTDGMESFLIGTHQVIAVNHEYVNNETNLPNNEEGMPKSLDDVKILQNMQGVTVMEVAEGADGWQIVLDSPFNRRIHHNTPMKLSGPAAGSDLVKTAADPNGVDCLGTFNNCGAGKTPWGTYLTCEENFNGYYGSTDANFKMPDDFKRYGIAAETRYGYEKFDERFDVSKNPNEPRRAGYVVEIDPSDASSTPIKRTALGRIKHENAAVVIARDGRVVVYMGDDERGEFLYKYVSNGIYVPGGDTSKLLDEGTLYVAKFSDEGTGEWLALTPDTTGMKADEIYVFTRQAASKVGATTMDRPEWVAVNPVAIEAYCALTNNSNRAVLKDGKMRTNAGGDVMDINAVNPREGNEFGQIVRWYPENDDHADGKFKWDLFVMAGNPDVHKDGLYAGSSNINSGNMFNSTGLLWIQTDGEDSNEGDFIGQGNNQMLAGDPATGRIERFLTGPKGGEVTGMTWTGDKRTMFVGIQHPNAPFPDGEGKLPRSTIVAVKREDNAKIG